MRAAPNVHKHESDVPVATRMTRVWVRVNHKNVHHARPFASAAASFSLESYPA